MTTLHDLFDHVSRDLDTDLARLEQQARERAARETRRRRTAAVLGSTAVAASVVLGVSLLGGGSADAPYADSSTSSASPTPAPTSAAPSRPAPLTGRSAAALLREVVGEVAPGTTTDYAGEGDVTRGHGDVYAELLLRPTAGGGFGTVSVNVQGRRLVELLGGPTCPSGVLDCEVGDLPGGDTVVTYRNTPDGDGDVRLVAEVWRADGSTRFVVAATNGRDLGAGRWDVSRPTAVLSVEQLAAVVTDQRWGPQVPGDVAAEGERLEPYRSLGGSLD
ncbi:hypothetical protein KDN32_03850 [Nocardioides sp. J2M5]|uniref:hypothetical protein n=1 Tax=Nocardioides palaemonis TaxID=2829810 RepID=UPI001BAD4749|nr:hypothetical protein [Nocardioides palaemonis]MBS2936875.1 hypothetical protein [Nocardioides palaemonis]